MKPETKGMLKVFTALFVIVYLILAFAELYTVEVKPEHYMAIAPAERHRSGFVQEVPDMKVGKAIGVGNIRSLSPGTYAIPLEVAKTIAEAVEKMKKKYEEQMIYEIKVFFDPARKCNDEILYLVGPVAEDALSEAITYLGSAKVYVLSGQSSQDAVMEYVN